MRFDSVTEALE